MARYKGAKASIVWVRETQVGADNFAATIDTEKPIFFGKMQLREDNLKLR